jgi:MFS transporter, AAHS family, 4-hydroxybenzoate transporter
MQEKLKNLVDNSPMTTFQIIIVAMCFILNMNDGIDVLLVSFSSADITKEWGLTSTQMGGVFSAGLAGMTLGAFFLAPFADVIGRRKIFVFSLILISLGMLLVSQCDSYFQILLFRFITGLGIGGILPTMAATASEFSNQKNRDFNVGLIQAGWPLGAIFTGFFCNYAIAEFGWKYAFFIAGCLSLLMLIGVWFFMTDTLDFLMKKQPKNALQKINLILTKMNQIPLESLPEKPIEAKKSSVLMLFDENYLMNTIKLWLAVFFGFFTLYTLMSWIPKIAKDYGFAPQDAIYAGIALNFGAFLGTIFMGLVAKKLGLRKTILSFMLIAIVCMLVYSNISLTFTLIFILNTMVGIFVQGGFNGLYPTFARVYPAEIRTTGTGIAIGIGRFGAILGPLVFGVMKDAKIDVSTILSLFSIHLLVTGFAIWMLKSKNL